MSTTLPKSPCILVCAIEPASGHCYGCGRSRDEIANWIRFTDHERDEIMSVLPERLEKVEHLPRRVTRRSRLAGGKKRVTSLADVPGFESLPPSPSKD